MNKKKIPIYRAEVSLRDDETGIFAMSFVDDPANRQSFVALKTSPPVKLNLNRSKQILTGVVLIPDQLIYRNDAHFGEYYLQFSAQEIEKIAHKMMKKGLALYNTTHQHESDLKGNYLTELWMVKNPKKDKTVALGLGEYPEGTLVASYKITDPEYWRKEVLSGHVKGFSLEGYFNFNSIKMKKNTTKAAKLAVKKRSNPIGSFFRSMATLLEGEGDTVEDAEALVEVAEKDEVDAGEPYVIFETADGGEIWVDADGFATMGGEQMPAGEHVLADGNFIVIDEDGRLVVTQQEPQDTENDVPETTLKAARARGKQFLKMMGDPKNSEIERLRKQVAALKKQSSTPKAKQLLEAGLGKPETFSEKMAAVIRNRIERRASN